MNADDLLHEALETLKDRGATRDAGDGERAMHRIVATFNALTGRALSETDGWVFMLCLKLGRAHEGGFHRDDWVDLIGYAALASESAIRAQDFEEWATAPMRMAEEAPESFPQPLLKPLGVGLHAELE